MLITLAACGGNSDKKASSTSTSTSSTAAGAVAGATGSTASGATPTTAKKSTAATGKPSPSDAAHIDKLVFVTDDFPSGWKGTASSPPDPNDDAARQLSDCVGGTPPEAETAHKYGDSFSNSDSTQVSAEASTVATASDFKRDKDAISGPKLSPCLKEAFNKEMQKEVPGGGSVTVDIGDLSAKKYGDVTVARQITITAKGATGSAKIYVDFVFMGKNRAEVTASFLNVNAPFDSGLESDLLSKLGKRVDDA